MSVEFIGKLFHLLESGEHSDVIEWQEEDGKSVVVHQPDEMARDILPRMFNQRLFSSFVRQLHKRGFYKISQGRRRNDK